jgi:hypothetical protein
MAVHQSLTDDPYTAGPSVARAIIIHALDSPAARSRDMMMMKDAKTRVYRKSFS